MRSQASISINSSTELGIVYKKTEELYIEWQRVTPTGTTSDNEWKRVTTNDNECYNEWQQVVQRVTANDNEWYNEWQRMTKSDHFS